MCFRTKHHKLTDIYVFQNQNHKLTIIYIFQDQIRKLTNIYLFQDQELPININIYISEPYIQLIIISTFQDQRIIKYIPVHKVINFSKHWHDIDKVMHKMSSKDKITQQIGSYAMHVDFSFISWKYK